MATSKTVNIAKQRRHDWPVEEVMDLYTHPFNDLLIHALTIHRQDFNPNKVQVSTLLSIKTGSQ